MVIWHMHFLFSFFSVSMEVSLWYMRISPILFLLMSRLNTYTLFIQECFNRIISFSSLYLICIDFSQFFFQFSNFLVRSHPCTPYFCINISHCKFSSNLWCYCEYRDKIIYGQKAFTNTQNPYRHTHIHTEIDETLLKLKLLRINLN